MSEGINLLPCPACSRASAMRSIPGNNIEKPAEAFSEKLLPGEPRITGSGRITSQCPKPDKKGKMRRYAVEMWMVSEARIEAAGNANATLELSDIHAHAMSESDGAAVHDVLTFGVTPDSLQILEVPRALTWTTEPPEKPGWYFARKILYGETPSITVWYCENPADTACVQMRLNDKPEWAGPIPMPKEPTI